MRFLILIALCVALTGANYNKYRFQQLLNRYRDIDDRDYDDDDYGLDDDVEDMMGDWADKIRRDPWRILGNDQCPRNRDIRDIRDIRDLDEDCYDRDTCMGDMIGGRSWRNWDDETDMDRIDMDRIDMDQIDTDQIDTGFGKLRQVQEANTKLASRLYKQTKEEKDDKNTVSSPLSVQLGLAALNSGARGNTKRQIARVIAGSLRRQERRQIFKMLTRHFKGMRNDWGGNTKINSETAIVISATTPAQRQFIERVRLGAQVKKCNFHQQPQQCRNMINNWMAQRTNMKIKHIIPRDAVTTNTKMVLVNGLEMKAAWGRQMRRHITKQAKFFPLDQQRVKIVEVMETQGRFKYFEDELVKVVGIPTQQKQLTLYTIVPKDKDGLTQVEKAHLQDGVQLKHLLDKTDRRHRTVGVQLPKFQVKQKIDVRRTLKKQGVTDAFDPQHANFAGITGISNNEQAEIEDNLGQMRDLDSPYGILGGQMGGLEAGKLHLNKFIHQATIKVTEHGITAATDFSNLFDYEREQFTNRLPFDRMEIDQLDDIDEIRGLMGQQSIGQKVVKANRAFAFAVKHNPTNQVVLVGRVVDATQKKVSDSQQTINGVDQL